MWQTKKHVMETHNHKQTQTRTHTQTQTHRHANTQTYKSKQTHPPTIYYNTDPKQIRQGKNKTSHSQTNTQTHKEPPKQNQTHKNPQTHKAINPQTHEPKNSLPKTQNTHPQTDKPYLQSKTKIHKFETRGRRKRRWPFFLQSALTYARHMGQRYKFQSRVCSRVCSVG